MCPGRKETLAGLLTEIKMELEEALELISRIETLFLLEHWQRTEIMPMVLALLLRLRHAPGPPEIIKGKIMALQSWVYYLFQKYESCAAKDTVKEIILSECQSLRHIISHGIGREGNRKRD